MLDVEALEKDNKFKSSVLPEMKCVEKKLCSLKEIISEYVSEIGSVHKNNMQIIAEAVSNSDALISGAIDSFKAEFPDESIVGLSAVELDKNGRRRLICYVNDIAIKNSDSSGNKILQSLWRLVSVGLTWGTRSIRLVKGHLRAVPTAA